MTCFKLLPYNLRDSMRNSLEGPVSRRKISLIPPIYCLISKGSVLFASKIAPCYLKFGCFCQYYFATMSKMSFYSLHFAIVYLLATVRGKFPLLSNTWFVFQVN